MRLTNDIRDNIRRKALANVPVIDYHALLIPVVQGVLCDHMPDHVRRAYDDPAERPYLHTSSVSVRQGNTDMYLKSRREDGYWQNHEFYGVTQSQSQSRYGTLDIRVDEAALARLKTGTLAYDLSQAVIKSGFFHKHIEQEALFESVKRRLGDTLRSVTTIKRLYDVLEPELHHLIPEEGDKTAGLPATAAPVVDDLRKLGAELPTVAKAN